jgi:hypothetical protein
MHELRFLVAGEDGSRNWHKEELHCALLLGKLLHATHKTQQSSIQVQYST